MFSKLNVCPLRGVKIKIKRKSTLKGALNTYFNNALIQTKIVRMFATTDIEAIIIAIVI